MIGPTEPGIITGLKAALHLARLGLVKMMIGGVIGWINEGFALTPS